MADRSPIHITRKDPDLGALRKAYRKQKDGEIVRRINIIILMLLIDNIARVAELAGVSDDTVRRWIEAFNEGGIDGLTKKNDLGVPRF
jgi:transposase